MKGVPASFEVEDELYYFNAEPEKDSGRHRVRDRARRDLTERAIPKTAPCRVDRQSTSAPGSSASPSATTNACTIIPPSNAAHECGEWAAGKVSGQRSAFSGQR
jgi:hypothetical protein